MRVGRLRRNWITLDISNEFQRWRSLGRVLVCVSSGVRFCHNPRAKRYCCTGRRGFPRSGPAASPATVAFLGSLRWIWIGGPRSELFKRPKRPVRKLRLMRPGRNRESRCPRIAGNCAPAWWRGRTSSPFGPAGRKVFASRGKWHQRCSLTIRLINVSSGRGSTEPIP